MAPEITVMVLKIVTRRAIGLVRKFVLFEITNWYEKIAMKIYLDKFFHFQINFFFFFSHHC